MYGIRRSWTSRRTWHLDAEDLSNLGDRQKPFEGALAGGWSGNGHGRFLRRLTHPPQRKSLHAR